MFFALKRAVILIFLLYVGVSCAQESSNILQESLDDKFQVGQKWKYKTRKAEKGSLLIILKIEESLNETIVHVAINGLQIKNERAHNGISQNIRLLTFTKEALLKSVTKLKKRKVPLPEYKSGYLEWKNAYLNAEAGYFGIPVRDAITVIENSMIY